MKEEVPFMKITCIQMNMIFGTPDVNFGKARSLITAAAEDSPDVIVLPETWNTGFFPKEHLAGFCDRNGCRAKEEIGSLAKKFNVNIVAGSIANLKNGRIYNTALVFDRTGACIADYDKTHLFSPMGENHYFTPGNHLCRFRLDGKSCGLMICYDLRFPELARSLALQGTDLLFAVSQWPAGRISHLEVLTRARAIENQVFLVCCNSCGTAGNTIFGGNSVIIDPLGTPLSRAGESEALITADCDFSILNQIRSSIPVLRDRRSSLYQL